MAVYKEEKTNTWRVIYRYTDWTGERKQSQKRGFKTKREALAWEREQLNKAMKRNIYECSVSICYFLSFKCILHFVLSPQIPIYRSHLKIFCKRQTSVIE